MIWLIGKILGAVIGCAILLTGVLIVVAKYFGWWDEHEDWREHK
jgi:hypothetical protein